MKLEVRHKIPSRILTPASGYLKGYTHTLNPYVGCAYQCSYCYVRQMPVALFRDAEWGHWVDVKLGAAEKLKRELSRAKAKGPVMIFMSSSTDPYQPLEFKEHVTRSLLEVMVENQPNFLFIQTRGPLVTRDVDLFLQLKNKVRVSITIETDLEDMRKAFTPSAPPIPVRMKALQRLTELGIPTQAAIAPVLPCSSNFANALRQITHRVCVDDFFMGDGSLGKRTEKIGVRSIYQSLEKETWYTLQAHETVIELLRQTFTDDQIYISQPGFMP